MTDKFKWFEYDINNLLPFGWVDEIKQVALKYAKLVVLEPRSVTSRELDPNLQIEVLVVNGNIIKDRLPWLYELYLGYFRNVGQKIVNEQLLTAVNPLYAINLNIQRGAKMRYECHVDSNPLQGLLYVTSHPIGSGGELVVSNVDDVFGQADIERNSETIYPKSGHLVFFDARKNPHFVKNLKNDNDERIVVTMNFYTPSSTENNRPNDLNYHLFGEDD